MFSENKKSKSSKQSKSEASREQNKISEGTVFTGDLVGSGSFRIEGKLVGTLKTPGKVVLGKTGFIDGNLECDSADVEGKITGKVNVSNTLTLRSTAHIEGEVTVGRLAIEPEATFNATCKMKGSVKSLNDERRKIKGSKETKETA